MSALVPQIAPDGLFRVRTVDIDGTPWLVATDVCDMLGLSNPSRQCETLLDGSTRHIEHMTRSGIRTVLAVSEAGLYELITRSSKPETEQFRRWLFEDVLPTLRRTGTYTVPVAPISIEQAIAELTATRIALEASEAARAKDSTAAEFARQYLEHPGGIEIGDLAKSLMQDPIIAGHMYTRTQPGIGRNSLFAILRSWGWIMREDHRPYQTAVDRGLLLEHENGYYTDKRGLRHKTTQTVVTSKGVATVWKRLRDQAAQPGLPA
jgi:anti-repressor protein